MAAPEYVPNRPTEHVRSYISPPWSGNGWEADRPADLEEGQPRGSHLGSPGPDQGYALKIFRYFEDRIRLQPGERMADVRAGICLVAMKRASLFGRAPVSHDIDVALQVWGFTDAAPPLELVDARKRLFEESANHHHYALARAIPDAVPADVLRNTPAQVASIVAMNWRDALNLPEHH